MADIEPTAFSVTDASSPCEYWDRETKTARKHLDQNWKHEFRYGPKASFTDIRLIFTLNYKAGKTM